MGVTIEDIAKAANVSPSTVSRAIANNPRISEKTRKKIFKIIEEMNYHPNYIARSLANKSTNIVGVVVMGTTEKAFQHPFFPEILRGIASVAYKNKYKILISSVNSLDEEKQIVGELTQSGITDGIILLSSRVKDPSISYLSDIKFPYVIVGRPENENEVNWVDNDNVSIGYKMTKHLIDMGCTDIAFLGVNSEFIVTLDRLKGYKMALADHNIPVDEKLIVEGKFVDDAGYELMKKVLDKGIVPSGVIACDDFLAFGAIKYLNENGLKVPDDVAVAGFNNVPLSNYFTPPLTSVEINAFSLGAKAFELFMAGANSEFKSFNRAIIPAELVIRESTQKK
ncbi:transcriptional regulator [Clostridium thermosuccinogenes]|uniref:Transcriptional regulator n=1 Tax=Clostridium thermosuccinogenes TaxID=84032 RepID=A0A2K2F5E7_9CLOT|nr:LacI family DNA-binding transcriptional regulator [Pseudoclostridium thermosuccinogenes]AUS97763.1 transcriptional regulator [Pseudoclostridium thermosuccinogenes]PNT94005.1 transcriptional regulator [Pseudoclostridium thermosuccinogenes]PNT98127.1 transcriptional regulator [Pseudoclostridium thermosuccinogenes]PNU00098.1 transcriptional regulator [Pseudoclostridium thermosuccinogenes]